ncbi:MAG TPA: hypothetical protein VM513_11665 [Kofleriaceae bacterium]|jgi:hypothetical protein|nr:hypothetical protein [Kofleriaceae bacterium]
MSMLERAARDAGTHHGHEHDTGAEHLDTRRAVSYVLTTYGMSAERIALGLRESGHGANPEVWVTLQSHVGLAHMQRVRAAYLANPNASEVLAQPASADAHAPAAHAHAGHEHAGHGHEESLHEDALDEDALLDLAAEQHVPAPPAPAQARPSRRQPAPGRQTQGRRTAAAARPAAPPPLVRTRVAREHTILGVRVIAGPGTAVDVMTKCERIINQLMHGNVEAQQRFLEKRVTIVVIPSNVPMTNLPEFASLRTEETFDDRDWSTVRGNGGTTTRDGIMIGIGEETLVQMDASQLLPGAQQYPNNYSVGMHELAHTLLREGLSDDQRREVRRMYDRRRREDRGNRKGTWSDTYASSNVDEYFAQSTNVYFGTNGISSTGNGAHWLFQHDQPMYQFLYRLYGDPLRRVAPGAP